MPDTSPEAAAPDDGIERLLGDGGAEGRGALDVPEWVSELRRLYVEPKTRASLRQQGAIAPQKRKLGLPGDAIEESGRGTSPPDAIEGEVASWLTSYLVATGHAADGDPRPRRHPPMVCRATTRSRTRPTRRRATTRSR